MHTNVTSRPLVWQDNTLSIQYSPYSTFKTAFICAGCARMHCHVCHCRTTALWADPSYIAGGVLAWPDFWPPTAPPELEDVVHDMVGLDHAGLQVWWQCS